MDSSNFKVVCDHCDAKLANVFCHSDGAFLCPQCDAQVHSVNKLAQRHLRVPCQSCPVWAYREAKSRGRLLDMPLAVCLTRNLQMDIFDGSTPCWPSNNASSVAMGTPQSDASSPQATTAAPPALAGSPNSEVHAAALQQASTSWPQNSALAMAASQPQPMAPASLLCASMSEGAEQADAVRAVQYAISPFTACSGSVQAAKAAPPHPQPVPERSSVQDAQISTSTAAVRAAPAAAQQLPQAAQSQHSQHTLRRAASQELMDAVDSMDVALLLDTFGTPLDELQDKRKADVPRQQQQQLQHEQAQQQFLALQQQQAAEQQSRAGALCSGSVPSVAVASAASLGNPMSLSPSWAPLAQHVQAQQQQAHLQQQQQQQQEQHRQQQQQQQHHTQQLQQQQQFLCQEQLQQQQRQAQVIANCIVSQSAFAVPSSEPVAVPGQRQQQQQQAMRSLSGMSCLTQSGLSSSNTDGGQLLGSARSSNTMLLQSLEQQVARASCSVPLALSSGSAAMAAATGWTSMETVQRQLQQLQQQQQQVALQYLQQQQQQVAAALAAAQQQQQSMHLLQRSMTDDLPRTSPISIGNGAAAVALAAAAARRDASLRAGLGLSDPGISTLSRGRSLAQSPMSLQPSAAGTAFSSGNSLLDNLSGIAMDTSSIAAAATATAADQNPLAASGAPAGLFAGTAGGGPPGANASATAVATAAPPLGASCRSFDAASSSLSGLPMAVVGSGGSTSVSPSNCNTLAGAISERHVPMTAQQLAQQMVLPGSAPPALGLATSVSMISRGGSCELSESQLVRLSSDGYDGAVLGAAGMLGGSLGMLGLGCSDADTASLLTHLDRPDGVRDMDAERAAQINRYKQKRMMRMRALAEGAKKVRYECRKQLADTRPRVRGRFAKVNSSDTLMDFAVGGVSSFGGQMTCNLPATSSGNNAAATGSVVSGSACTAPPGVTYHGASGGGSAGGGWGHHCHASSQPHMQRIDEEAASEGQSSFMLQSVGPMPLSKASCTGAEPGTGADGEAEMEARALAGIAAEQARAQQHQQLMLHRAQSSSMLDAGGRLGGSNSLNEDRITTNTVTAVPSPVAEAAPGCTEAGGPLAAAADVTQQDCVITEHDLAALGVFDDLARMSQGSLSNAGNSNEDMDESAESMNEGASARLGTSSGGGARPAAHEQLAQQLQQQEQQLQLQMQVPRSQAAVVPQAALTQMQNQQLQQQQQTQPRLSVLDRPIMYGMDRSQFSAAQLSLLDSILTDQFRPSGPVGRH